MVNSARIDAVEAYYVPLGDGWFEATTATIGPWGTAHQHGGPPTALLAREIGRVPGPDQALLTRITCEILRPIPVGRVRVTARVLRPGRNVQLVEAELNAGEETVVVARAWRMSPERTEPLPAEPPSPPELPAEPTPMPRSWSSAVGYLRSIDWHFAEGSFRPGPAVVWARQRPKLVAGEDPTAVQRLLTLADSGSGVGAVLDFRHWTYINTEISVHLDRPPAGEWFCLEASTTIGAYGVGLAQTRLWDQHGPVGAAAQSLLVRARQPGKELGSG
jgi:Thioesterase-like superfamily